MQDLGAFFEREWGILAGSGRASACWREGRRGWSMAEAQDLAERLREAGLSRGLAAVPSGGHPGRIDEWCESRSAALQACQRTGYGAVLTSLAHSRAAEDRVHALAIAWVGEEGTLGIGVDLEPAGRAIAEGLGGRILAPGEERVLAGVSALEAWVIKEAVFKAHPRNALKVVPQVKVSSFADATGVAFLAELPEPIRFRLARAPEWLAAFAVCMRA